MVFNAAMEKRFNKLAYPAGWTKKKDFHNDVSIHNILHPWGVERGEGSEFWDMVSPLMDRVSLSLSRRTLEFLKGNIQIRSKNLRTYEDFFLF